METKIQKWGNSLGVRLPKALAQAQQLAAGRAVRVSAVDDKIIIEPQRTKQSLSALLTHINAQNLHTETDYSDAQGNEVW